MAVSGKTAAPHEIPFFLGSDSPPDMGDVTEAMASQIHSRLDNISTSQLVVPGGEADDGKLLIVKDGAAAYRAMKGDATIDEDGNLQLGAKVVGTPELGDKAVTTAKINDGAVSLAKLAGGLGLATEYLADGAVTSRKAKLSAGVVSASGVTSLFETASYVDVPGTTLEISPEVNSTLLVVATWAVQVWNPFKDNYAELTIRVDGVDQERRAVWGQNVSSDGGIPEVITSVDMVSQVYAVGLSAGKHTIKMRARGGNLRQIDVLPNYTGYLYVLIAA